MPPKPRDCPIDAVYDDPLVRLAALRAVVAAAADLRLGQEHTAATEEAVTALTLTAGTAFEDMSAVWAWVQAHAERCVADGGHLARLREAAVADPP